MDQSGSSGMQLRPQLQKNDVADEVSAITAVVRPILGGILYALKGDVVAQFGGHKKITLDMLARLYRPGDRDCGICFEYAVHDALSRGEQDVCERIIDALKMCKLSGHTPSSILFGAEKTGALNLINTAKEKLTDDSRLMAGTRGQPIRVKRHIDSLAAAFRKRGIGEDLPSSISEVWKADLFVGISAQDRWLATTIKINREKLEVAQGLRIGIVPAHESNSDAVRLDERKNLVVCPIPTMKASWKRFMRVGNRQAATQRRRELAKGSRFIETGAKTSRQNARR